MKEPPELVWLDEKRQFVLPPLVRQPKPDWDSRNEAGFDAMVAWVYEHLLVRKAEYLNQCIAEVGDQWKHDPETGRATITDYKYEDRIASAEKEGKVDLLRQAHPMIRDLIQPPERDRGKYPRTAEFRMNQRVVAAVEDVYFIRELWKQEFGRERRTRDNPPFAIDIAAAFWGVDVDDVVNGLKNIRRNSVA